MVVPGWPRVAPKVAPGWLEAAPGCPQAVTGYPEVPQAPPRCSGLYETVITILMEITMIIIKS